MTVSASHTHFATFLLQTKVMDRRDSQSRVEDGVAVALTYAKIPLCSNQSTEFYSTFILASAIAAADNTNTTTGTVRNTRTSKWKSFDFLNEPLTSSHFSLRSIERRKRDLVVALVPLLSTINAAVVSLYHIISTTFHRLHLHHDRRIHPPFEGKGRCATCLGGRCFVWCRRLGAHGTRRTSVQAQ